MTTPKPPRNPLNTGVLIIAGLAALIIATGAPNEKALRIFSGWGLSDGVAVALCYVLPLVAIVGALMIGRMVVRHLPPVWRWPAYAGFGGVGGFVLGFCLDLFAGLPGLLSGATGTLTEPTKIDLMLSAFGVMCAVMGAMVGAIALFGSVAAHAIQIEDHPNPEMLDVRRVERGVYGWSSIGMFGLAATCVALVIARLAPESARLAPVLIAVAGGVLNAVASYVLWRGFDELERRQVIDGYAASGVVLTLMAFVWACLQPLGYLPAIDATGVFLALMAVQLFATCYATLRTMGHGVAMGRLA